MAHSSESEHFYGGQFPQLVLYIIKYIQEWSMWAKDKSNATKAHYTSRKVRERGKRTMTEEMKDSQQKW